MIFERMLFSHITIAIIIIKYKYLIIIVGSSVIDSGWQGLSF